MKLALSELDKLVKEGRILEAFDKYFAEEVITYDEAGNKTTTKAEKRTLLEEFLRDFIHTEEITLVDSFINGTTSYSNFRFVFGKISGEKFRWDEVIIREWKDGLVISEFYSNQDYAALKKSKAEPKKTAVKVAAAPKAEKAAPKAKSVAAKAEKAAPEADKTAEKK